MLLAPILAVALAVLLTGAIYYSPLPTTQSLSPQVQSQATPKPSPVAVTEATPTTASAPASENTVGQLGMPTPAPTQTSLAPTPSTIPSSIPSVTSTDGKSYYQVGPSAQPEFTLSQDLPSGLLPILFVVAAVVVAILAVGLLFSERNINKED
jgi:hypothetical protein